MSNRKLKLVVATLAALFAEIFVPVFGSGVQAAPPPQFSQAFVRLDRLQTATVTGGTICATPTTTATEADFQITFPTQTGPDFIVDGTASDWTVTTTNMPVVAGTTAAAWPGIATATAVSGHTVTFPSSDLTVGTMYCFNFAPVLTNGAAGNSLTGTMHTRDGSGTVIDESNYAVALVTDDQIVVSAVVPPTFVFSLSGNTDAFPSNLDPAVIKSTAGRIVSVTTNAKGGWIGWVKDSNQGLYSATANYNIHGTANSPSAGDNTVNGSPTTIAINTENYVLDADITADAAGGCTVAIDPEYDGATASAGGTLSANFQPVVACTGAAPATSNGDQVTLIERASIAGGTPAGSDYTDTITVVAAGNF